ncbi:MAG TPA: glycosyltransferase, partial [Dongiaceae bacterium]|nr:glycosyltransferase [Dongiaceae bacterium]
CLARYAPGAARLYRGVRRVVLPAPRLKSLEKPVHAVLSLLHAAATGADVVLVLGIAAGPFVFLPRAAGARVVVNTDGLEWRRRKWGALASSYLKFAERAVGAAADHLVTDAHCVRDYYRARYGRESTFIPYGARPAPATLPGVLQRLGLEAGRYVLYVSRFDPENNALLVRRAYEQVRSDWPLVMVGSAPYADDYVRAVRDTRDPRIRFPGAIYGDGYLELLSRAGVYVQASEVGGTHPALVEAIGLGCAIVANDVPEHREVLGEAGAYYDGGEAGLAAGLQAIIDAPARRAAAQAAAQAIAARFDWGAIVDDYERLFATLAGRAAPAIGRGARGSDAC